MSASTRVQQDGVSVDEVRNWSTELDALHERLAGLFQRSEPRARCLGYLRGLLSAVDHKNGWQLAEHLG